MCGCKNKGLKGAMGAKSTNGGLAKTGTSCTKSLDYYKSIDTSKWTPAEQAVVISQINIYGKKCGAYSDLIETIQSRYL
jgi:hypothetical protein